MSESILYHPLLITLQSAKSAGRVVDRHLVSVSTDEFALTERPVKGHWVLVEKLSTVQLKPSYPWVTLRSNYVPVPSVCWPQTAEFKPGTLKDHPADHKLHLYCSFSGGFGCTKRFTVSASRTRASTPMVRVSHARHRGAGREQLGVRCLVQGHFKTFCTEGQGSDRQRFDCRTTVLPSEPLPPQQGLRALTGRATQQPQNNYFQTALP